MAHQCIEISRDVKFNETLFPAKEAKKNQASTNDPPISESDNESDKSGLDRDDPHLICQQSITLGRRPFQD